MHSIMRVETCTCMCRIEANTRTRWSEGIRWENVVVAAIASAF